MGHTTVTRFKWFWAWNDDREERWLEEMARQGWHLERPGFPGFYHFAAGEPRDVAYCLDFRSGSLAKLEEYRQICRDAGWEEAGRMGSWVYFRKEFRDGRRPEFFSDRASRAQKYQRLLLLLVVMLPLVLNGMRLLLRREHTALRDVFGGLYGLVLLGMAVAIVRLIGRIRRLKKG
jgi:hypothetical protein